MLINDPGVGASSCVMIPSKLSGYPSETFSMPSNLKVSAFINIAMHEFSTPDNNIVILKEPGDHVVAFKVK